MFENGHDYVAGHDPLQLCVTCRAPLHEHPCFEQSGKPVRLGSEVGIDYGEDVDFGKVTRIYPNGTILVQCGYREVTCGAECLFPFEEQDEDDIWQALKSADEDLVRWARNGEQWAQASCQRLGLSY